MFLLDNIIGAAEAEIGADYDGPDYYRDVTVPAIEEAFEWIARGHEVIDLGRDNSVTAKAAIIRDGLAVLLVDCPAGGWAEIGAVKWPLEFAAPAAIAGSNCAPRYGLER